MHSSRRLYLPFLHVITLSSCSSPSRRGNSGNRREAGRRPVADALKIVDAARQANVPISPGSRRYNPSCRSRAIFVASGVARHTWLAVNTPPGSAAAGRLFHVTWPARGRRRAGADQRDPVTLTVCAWSPANRDRAGANLERRARLCGGRCVWPPSLDLRQPARSAR